MSCCAPGTEGAMEAERASHALPSSEELMLASRTVGEGLRQSDLSVPGVHCGTCITTVEGALNALPEVARARVNLSTRRVSVVWPITPPRLRSVEGAAARSRCATCHRRRGGRPECQRCQRLTEDT